MTSESTASTSTRTFDIETFMARLAVIVGAHHGSSEERSSARAVINREREDVLDLHDDVVFGDATWQQVHELVRAACEQLQVRIPLVTVSYQTMYVEEAPGRIVRFHGKHDSTVLLVDTPDRFARAMLQVMSARLLDGYYDPEDASDVDDAEFAASELSPIARVILVETMRIINTAVPEASEDSAASRFGQMRSELAAMSNKNVLASVPLLRPEVVRNIDLMTMFSWVVRDLGPASGGGDRIARFLAFVLSQSHRNAGRHDFVRLLALIESDAARWPDTARFLRAQVEAMDDDKAEAEAILEMSKTSLRRAGRAAYMLLDGRSQAGHEYERMEFELPDEPKFTPPA